MATPTHLLLGNEDARLQALKTFDAAATFAEPVYQQLVAAVARAYPLSAVGAEQVAFPATHEVPGLQMLMHEESLGSQAERPTAGPCGLRERAHAARQRVGRGRFLLNSPVPANILRKK